MTCRCTPTMGSVQQLTDTSQPPLYPGWETPYNSPEENDNTMTYILPADADLLFNTRGVVYAYRSDNKLVFLNKYDV